MTGCYGDSVCKRTVPLTVTNWQMTLVFSTDRYALNKRSLLENYKSYLKDSWTVSARRDGRSHRCNFYSAPMYVFFFMAVLKSAFWFDKVMIIMAWEPQCLFSALGGDLRENRETKHNDGDFGWKRTKIPTFCSKSCLGEADILDVRGVCSSNFVMEWFYLPSSDFI